MRAEVATEVRFPVNRTTISPQRAARMGSVPTAVLLVRDGVSALCAIQEAVQSDQKRLPGILCRLGGQQTFKDRSR
ncbi:hypothetical protein [Dictyobacter arantiisoli]|uniref:Uncharacterized protein n=1 Tax=Dictyobacter arantiisoli TaxID=2014874 RepID=A0A5A5TKM5_9CHLR|nr:hypothetical protein [Dictyobacter arantiisoli]GCF11464.1 hypothetical protein KDI_50280 [Dictyobacter arantiisoli]